MPCYNCKDTVEEALQSVYQQDFKIPYEVIMVDDGSTDGTGDFIVELSKKYKNIRCVFHEQNKGGGAARNTGIKGSDGDLIFCLDADNFLSKDCLSKMVDYLIAKNCLAVAVYERRFFGGKNYNKYESGFNNTEFIVFVDLFKKIGITIDNFLYTRQAYEISGGYPENHGFDTQCFEVRFLSKGFKIYICPEAIFYHRQGNNKKTYFERVYEKGNFSINYYLIIEEILYLFSSQVRLEIMNYDIFQNNLLNNNIKNHLDSIYAVNNNFFITRVENCMAADCPGRFFKDNLENAEMTEIFYRSVFFYKKSEYTKSLECLTKLVSCGFDSKVIYFNILRNYIALSKKFEENKTEDEVIVLINSLILKGQKEIIVRDFFTRLKNKLKNVFK